MLPILLAAIPPALGALGVSHLVGRWFDAMSDKPSPVVDPGKALMGTPGVLHLLREERRDAAAHLGILAEEMQRAPTEAEWLKAGAARAAELGVTPLAELRKRSAARLKKP